ncbi:hypothetical protein [Nonomuraea sp. NPDC003709]|uniref:hypothetical protein n=1 Tax=Nonomuraea sp. NPDC003709 TaxID=3154450 RepID=UPI0033AD3501
MVRALGEPGRGGIAGYTQGGWPAAAGGAAGGVRALFGGAHIATAQQRRIQRAERERLLETLHHPGASRNGSIGELLDGRWSPMPLRGRKSQLALMNA